jgi:hypothetical protein
LQHTPVRTSKSTTLTERHPSILRSDHCGPAKLRVASFIH